MVHICKVRGLLHRCRHEAVGVCQFCGRPFCALHGERHSTDDEVCTRPICQQKRVDLTEHLAWRTSAINRSNRGFCGMPDCEGGRWGQCSKCQALFCERHLQDRDERIRHGSISFSRPASMCDHCAARNKLWSRA